MKNLLEWIKNRLGFRNDFKNDYIFSIYCGAWGMYATWVVNDLSDTREKKEFHAWWRTEDTPYYAEETYVWAVDEEDVKRVLMKKYKIKENGGFELLGFKQVWPEEEKKLNSTPKTPSLSMEEIEDMMRDIQKHKDLQEYGVVINRT